jgi:hypothetical protein
MVRNGHPAMMFPFGTSRTSMLKRTVLVSFPSFNFRVAPLRYLLRPQDGYMLSMAIELK